MFRRPRLVVAGLVVIVAAGALYVSRRGPSRVEVETATPTRQPLFRSTVSASGEVVAMRYAEIGSSAMGKIVRLAVAEGDRVAAGQLLARIDPVQAESGASGATAQMQALAADERASGEQLRSASAELTAAQARAREADRQLARLRALKDQGVLAASELDTASAAAETAGAQVAAARAAVERARQTREAATRRVAQARAEVRSAADVVAKTSIVSPMAGTVTRLRVREGEMVVVGLQNQPGTTLMTISDLSAIDAEVKVAEADVLRLAIGQPASVTLEALPGKRFSARVVEIGASALPVTGTAAAAREFRVLVRLDEADANLRPGLTCDAEIVTSERQNVLTVPLQSVVLRQDPQQDAKRTGVFTLVDGKARFTPVTTGVIGGLSIEVSGIDERATVIVGPYQVLRELNDDTLVRATTADR